MNALTRRKIRPPLRVPVRMDQLDASENAFFGQALEQVKAQTYDRKLPQFKARQFIPLDPSIDQATESMIVRSYDMVGQARLLASYADDLPRSDVLSTETRIQFRGIGASYGYNLMEVRAAAKAGVSLDQKKAAAARRSVESVIDRVLAKGDSATGLVGMLNQPNATVYAVPNGAGGSPAWADKTPKEIVDDLIGICEEIINSTNEVEQPNMILVPRAQMTILRTTQFSIASDKTILEWFRANYGGAIGIDTWHRLQGAGAGGADRMVAYTMSPDHLQGAVPVEFEQLPVQERNLEFVVPCHARVGGVILYYPLSMAYGDGI